MLLIVLTAFVVLILITSARIKTSRESTTWPAVPGVVTATGRTNFGVRISPKVEYKYSVNNIAYAGNRISYSVIRGTETDKALARYRADQPVTVYYSPNDPAQSVLEPGESRSLTVQRAIHIGAFCLLLILMVLDFLTTEPSAPIVHYGDAPQLTEQQQADFAAAEKGDADAQYRIGIAFLEGRAGDSSKADGDKATAWLHKAEENGSLSAQNYFLLHSGYGEFVKHGPEAEVAVAQEAAEKGSPFAYAKLGRAYRDGKGLPRDMAKAIECFRKAGDAPGAKEALQQLNADGSR